MAEIGAGSNCSGNPGQIARETDDSDPARDDAKIAPVPFFRDAALEAALGRLVRTLPPDLADTPDLPVTAVRRLPASSAEYAPFPEALDARLKEALASRGMPQLYSHQADAMHHALAGRNVVVVTPTA